MRSILKILFFLTISFSCFGQELSKNLYFMSFSKDMNTLQNPTINLKKINFKINSYGLQVYNPSIGLFENYRFVTENQFERSDKMILIPTNDQYFSLNSNSFFNPYNNRRIDSFNPYGASNVGEFFALGVINMLLNKN